jgi:hypothetical protein
VGVERRWTSVGLLIYALVDESVSLPFTSVVSYHTNTFGCGVAKFSAELAKRLGVPFMNLMNDYLEDMGRRPLWSLKWSELAAADRSKIVTIPFQARWHRYSVFWHDSGHPLVNNGATHMFYADPSLGEPAVFCPSLLEPAKPRTVRLFSFGMAHKLKADAYQRVRELLEADGLDYHLRVSVGLHEGTSLSDATRHFDALKQIMGPEKVTILGILSDEAVALELRDADYVLAFFEKGLRANNTTVHAALSQNKIVVTNHDPQTPGYLKASTRDIVTRRFWENTIPYYYSWERLLEDMTKIYANTDHRQSQNLGR